MSNKPPINPYLALFIGVVAISTSAIFVKLSSAPSSIIATYRLLFSVLFMLPFVLLRNMKELLAMNKRDILFSTIAGVFLALHFILWFESLNYTSVASSVVLVTLQPLFSFIGGYLFFKEQLSWQSISSGFLALAGSFIIGWGDFQIGGMALWGDVLALLGAGAVTGYWLFGQNLRQRLSLMSYTFMVYSTSTITLLLYNFALHYPLYPYPTYDWLMFLLLAVIPTLLGHSVFNWLIKWINATTISMSILGEPIGAAILAYFLLHEIVTSSQFIGGAIILLGIYLFMKSSSQESTRKDNNSQKISQENVETEGTARVNYE